MCADASMLVKQYLVGARSALADKLLARPTITGTAMITRAEVSAALAKGARLGALTRADAGQSLSELGSHWPYYRAASSMGPSARGRTSWPGSMASGL